MLVGAIETLMVITTVIMEDIHPCVPQPETQVSQKTQIECSFHPSLSYTYVKQMAKPGRQR